MYAVLLEDWRGHLVAASSLQIYGVQLLKWEQAKRVPKYYVSLSTSFGIATVLHVLTVFCEPNLKLMFKIDYLIH